MIQKNQSRNSVSLSLLLIAGLFTACENDLQPLVGEPTEATQARAIYSTRTVNWNNLSDGTYTNSEAATDFGNVTGWNEARAYISSGTARVKLEPNALSGAGGMISNIDVSDGSEYELQYDVRFHSQFDWSRGGKVGFGFKIGDGNTGCDKADDGNGGSARIMWYTDNNGVTRLKPYIYYKDMPGNCGYDFGKGYPASGSIQKGTWYTIKIYVKSNTGTNTDGRLKVTIEDQVILDTAIRWTTNDAKRLINTMAFTSFRGGSDSYWESSTVGYIYYDNLSWTKIN
jgi:hypothetical protein